MNSPAQNSPSQNFPVLTATDLTKTYGSTTALAGVAVAIRAGEAIAVMGTSGSGKTTLLHCLSGIIRPDSGHIQLITADQSIQLDALGERARTRLRGRTFGFVFQQGLLLPELTALENAALPLMLAGMTRHEAEQRALRWLVQLGLGGCEERRIGQLSGGQVQRVALARSQVIEPAVTFADEPTGALDAATSADVLSALLEATAGRGGVLVTVTHDEQVAARCDRVVRLLDGRIISDSNPLEVIATIDGAATFGGAAKIGGAA